MNQEYIVEKVFEGLDFSKKLLSKGDYENCKFVNCVFTNTDLSESNFVECEFVNCDLSNATVIDTAFREVKFKGCKLMGLRFENCNEFLFSVDFEDCRLSLSSFYKRRIPKTNFTGCNLREVDFSEADLNSSVFDNCDLSGAIFEKTILEKADLRTSFNFAIDPEVNKIAKAKFTINGVGGLLNKYDIIIEQARET